MKSISILVTIVLFLILNSTESKAKLIQILHTNDFHSFIRDTHDNPEIGGYAALKSMVNDLKEEAANEGIPTLFVDGGDYLEGNINFFADDGAQIIKILNAMDYDAAVLGNHDYQMGTKGLENLYERMPPTFPIVGANVSVSNKYPNIRKHTPPYITFNFDDTKIAILGLTTDSLLYKWRMNDGKIKSPRKTANKYAFDLKVKKDYDAVIALTHMGLKADQMLVNQSKFIDLVIGGHSHDALHKVKYTNNKNLRSTPIVQTGEHGNFLGKLVINIRKGKPLEVVSYKLLPVKHEEPDPEITALVQETEKMVEDQYGIENLNEIIGEADINLINDSEKHTMWGDIIADSFRDATGAQVAIHVPSMAGSSIKKGPVTRMDIMGAYPRQFEFSQEEGWNVYSSQVYGFFLRLVVRVVISTGAPLYFSGVTFKTKKIGKVLVPYDIRIKGKRLRPFKKYSLALPEGIVRGGLGISGLVKFLLKKSRDTEVSIWKALENKFLDMGKITSSYYEDYESKHKEVGRIDRIMIPRWKDFN